MVNVVRFSENYILKLLDYFPIIGIIGARQVGKTTIINLIKEKISREVVYLDLELDSDRRKLEDAELYFNSQQDKCIIIDEVQRNKELFPLLRSLIDKNRIAGRFIIIGSASPELIRDSSESLAGRIAYIELSPFNIYELNFKNINKHWLEGGFPLSYLAPNSFLSSEWRENFIRTYLERDIPLLGLDIRSINFRKFINLLAHINAQILNYSNLSKSMELSNPTINKYIDFLGKAFLLRKLPAYTQNIKKRLVKAPKLYFTDTGILHQLLGINNFETLQANIYQGASWESYVINQIFSLLKKEYNLFYYRTHNGAELDLLIEKNQILYMSVEIKYTNAPKLSKGNLIAFDDIKAKDNFVITPSSDTYPIKNNITIISIKDFLLRLIKEGFTKVE